MARVLRLVAPIRVSIVVATYNSDPDRLRALIGSVAAQTLPADQIELVFVDDGSTDETPTRLHRYARGLPNVRVRVIPNSGWAGRPRNVGLGMARGEFVLFMDHDDVLFPRALEQAVAYGRRHRADVVNAKEVRTDGWSWGWDAFLVDVPRAYGIDPNPLIPMTPHKLYRRRFVRRHDLRFREGPRVFWEDIYFNLAAFSHGARVAVLSSSPFYHWVSTGKNNSESYDVPDAEFWANLDRLLAYHETALRDVQGGPEQITHQLRARVLAFVGPRLLALPDDDAERVYASAQTLVGRHGPPERDHLMRSVHRCRLELVRQGSLARQRELAEHDTGVTAVPAVVAVHWEGTQLVVSATTTLVGATGSPVLFSPSATGWTRALPAELGRCLSDAALDVTYDLQASTFVLSLKGRTTRSTWAVPGTSRVECRAADAGFGVARAAATARVDPMIFAEAHDLTADDVFDVAARLDIMGHTSHRALRATPDTFAAVLMNGTAAMVYRNGNGALSLDLHAARAVTRLCRPDPETARIVVDDDRTRVRLELPGVGCVGRTHLTGEVLTAQGARFPAVLENDDGRAVLRFQGPFPPGNHVLRTCFGGRTSPAGLVLHLHGAQARLTRQPEPA